LLLLRLGGGNASLGDDQVKSAVDYMTETVSK
jgi:cytochrome c5